MILAGAKARAISIPATIMSGGRALVAVLVTFVVLADGGTRYYINLGSENIKKRKKAKKKMLAGISLVPLSLAKLLCNTASILSPELTLGKLNYHRKFYHISKWYGDAIGEPFK